MITPRQAGFWGLLLILCIINPKLYPFLLIPIIYVILKRKQ